MTCLYLCLSVIHVFAQTKEHGRTGEFNILDFGATRDTMMVHTKAINEAIESCYRQGGGRVVIPPGKFKTGTIFLKDNVELHLDNGACLYASEDYADFPIQPRAAYRSLKDAGGWSALIYAVGARNIAVTGKGVIDGRGKGRKGRVGGVPGDADGRPRNILFISCKGVRISGISMRNSALWNQHYLDCEDVIVEHIHVFNHCNGNNDGIDIDGCRRFILSDSVIDSDDDGIVLKSTGLAPCEDVVINNCIVSSFANAIKCGTKSTGGYKNIDNIVIEGTECPLYVRLANRGRKYIDEAPVPPIGKMRNIQISNVTAYDTGNFCSSITGIPGGEIENIYLSNVRFLNKGGLVAGNCRTANDMQGKRHDTAGNVFRNQYWSSHREVKEDEKGYPQPTVWGNLPSYGLFIRNVRSIAVDNAAFQSEKPDPRIPVIAVNVGNLSLDRIQVNDISSAGVLLDNVRTADVDRRLRKSGK